MNSPLSFYLITNEPGLAAVADSAGVHRVMVDLESIGKAERQRGRNTLISAHSIHDIARVGAVLTSAELVTRVNPLGAHTETEVDAAVAAGTKRLMLPMFRTAHELERFVKLVNGRALITGLLETRNAWENVRDIATVSGIDDLHVGLTDLHLEMGYHFLFRCVAEGMIDVVAEACHRAGRRFGFGGVGRIGEGDLPAALIIGEHIRLGSSAVILGRVFHANSKSLHELRAVGIDLPLEISKVIATTSDMANRSVEVIERDRTEFRKRALAIDAKLAGQARSI